MRISNELLLVINDGLWDTTNDTIWRGTGEQTTIQSYKHIKITAIAIASHSRTK